MAAPRAGGQMLDVPVIDAADFHRETLPALLEGPNASLAVAALGDAPPLLLRVGDSAWLYRREGDRIVVAATTTGGRADDVLTLCLGPAAWSDLVQLVRTTPALLISGEIDVNGVKAALGPWERALRALWHGLPVADPRSWGGVVRDESGQPLDLDRSFTLADSDAELGQFLRAVGVVRVRGVFSPADVAALNAEVDRLSDAARPGDDRSWWVDTGTASSGQQALCRLVYASEQSPVIAALADDARLWRLVRLVADDLHPSTDRMEGIAVLLKPPGETRGLANIPWHTDCGLGGHPIMCPSVAVGIQLTGSSPETGCFEAIAGTHGASCPYPSARDLERWPHIVVPTEPGDVTVHIADLLHASPRPTGQGGRRTIYVTFHPPSLFDHVGPGEAYNDLIRHRGAGAVAEAVSTGVSRR